MIGARAACSVLVLGFWPAAAGNTAYDESIIRSACHAAASLDRDSDAEASLVFPAIDPPSTRCAQARPSTCIGGFFGRGHDVTTSPLFHHAIARG